MNILISPEVYNYLDELVTTLYEKGYFGFEEFAINYVDELLDDIQTNLSARVNKPAPEYFEKYGKNMKYAAFKKNRQTTWYVFFETYKKHDKITYLVRYISNNHVISQYF